MKLIRASAAATAAMLAAAVVAGCDGGSDPVGAESSPQASSSGELAASGSSTGATERPRSSTTATRTGPSATDSVGAEGQPAKVPPCLITSPAKVAAAFGGQVTTAIAATTGTGNPHCTFRLRSSNVSAPITVSMTMNTKTTTRDFDLVHRQAKGALAVSGLGSQAYYLPSESSLTFRRRATLVVVQVDVDSSAGTQYAKRLRSDAVAVGRSIAAQL